MVCPACARESAGDARFCAGCGTRLPSRPGHELTQANRRQLTSMFCDLVNSTGMAESLDAEDFRHVLLAYRQCCSRIVFRHDGEMARYVGDGVLAHFGFPIAREDDARHAVQAALEICEQIPDLGRSMQARFGVDLAVRIGVNTGIVVTDAPGDNHPLHTGGLVGGALNIAARLQQLARPNGVVIGQDTMRLVQGQFILNTLGPQDLRGLSREIVAYEVIDSSSARSLFEARAATGLSPLVGRNEQLDVLMQELAFVRAGRSRLVLVEGEPGIGKSRLVHEFQKRVERDTVVQITCHCLAQYQGTAFNPVAVELARVFGVQPGDPGPRLIEKVHAGLQRLGVGDVETATHLALVFAEAGNAVPEPAVPGSAIQRQILEAIATYVVAVASRVPLLLIFEDLHWADPSTLALLAYLQGRLAGSPVLILTSARPVPELALAADTRIELARITPAECRALIRVTASRELSWALVDKLIERSDGVPLFVEELAKAVEDGFDLGLVESDLAMVPASLNDTLMSRLDRLGAAKAIAQVAAAIGRSFHLDLLSSVLAMTAAAVRAELNRLVDAGLVFPAFASGPRGAVFEFKHELLRNVAYNSLLRTTRSDIHARIATRLEGEFADEAGRHPELVAHHLTEAGMAARAIPFWLLAGNRAIRKSASLEAVAHLSRALALIETMPTTEARSRKELELRLTLVAPLMATKGYGAPELDRHLERAMALSAQAADRSQLLPVIYARWSYQQVTGQVASSGTLADQVVELAERQLDDEARMIGYRLQGTWLQVTGSPAAGVDRLLQSVALFDPSRHTPLAYLYGGDIKVLGLCSLSLARWVLGKEAAAERDMAAAWDRAQELRHAHTSAYCISYYLSLSALMGRTDGYEDLLLRHEQLLATERLPVWQATTRSHQGWLATQQGDLGRAVTLLRESVAAMEAIHMVYWRPMVLMWLGQALHLAGSADEAEAAFVRAHDTIEGSGERWAEAELYRLWGGSRSGEDGVALLRRSLDVAARQGAVAFARRTEADLASRSALQSLQLTN